MRLRPDKKSGLPVMMVVRPSGRTHEESRAKARATGRPGRRGFNPAGTPPRRMNPALPTPRCIRQLFLLAQRHLDEHFAQQTGFDDLAQLGFVQRCAFSGDHCAAGRRDVAVGFAPA
jgi:hypothetical protein